LTSTKGSYKPGILEEFGTYQKPSFNLTKGVRGSSSISFKNQGCIQVCLGEGRNAQAHAMFTASTRDVNSFNTMPQADCRFSKLKGLGLPLAQPERQI